MAPPNYRPGTCCESCEHGYGSGINSGWYCGLHARRQVQRWCICDDWEQMGGED
jgi:hypothetical protein